MSKETELRVSSKPLPLPRTGGTYMLVLALPNPVRLVIGKLGEYDFPAGWYLYSGSALGGLQGRVSRHLKGEKKPHWHIDYLSAAGSIVDVWFATGHTRKECLWAQRAISLPRASVPMPRFGSSDCRCETHLVYLPAEPGAEERRMVVSEPSAPEF